MRINKRPQSNCPHLKYSTASDVRVRRTTGKQPAIHFNALWESTTFFFLTGCYVEFLLCPSSATHSRWNRSDKVQFIGSRFRNHKRKSEIYICRRSHAVGGKRNWPRAIYHKGTTLPWLIACCHIYVFWIFTGLGLKPQRCLACTLRVLPTPTCHKRNKEWRAALARGRKHH